MVSIYTTASVNHIKQQNLHDVQLISILGVIYHTCSCLLLYHERVSQYQIKAYLISPPNYLTFPNGNSYKEIELISRFLSSSPKPKNNLIVYSYCLLDSVTIAVVSSTIIGRITQICCTLMLLCYLPTRFWFQLQLQLFNRVVF